MREFEGLYFDGRSSAAHPVSVRVDAAGQVSLRGEHVDEQHAYADIRISARLGDSPRYLHLPGGAKCETRDNEAVDEIVAALGAYEGAKLLHVLESRWILVAGAALFTLALLWAGFEYGLPYLARKVALTIPPQLEASLGEQSLATLDAHVLKPTRLTEAHRERARRLFERVVARHPPGYRLRLELRRSHALGANAFALPAGIIVVTDELVELAAHDGELLGVLAHEVGHAQHRHIMRSILQSSVVAVLVATLLGDVTSVTGLAASIPTFLMEQRYSREFEQEADAFALAYLRADGVSIEHFANMLVRLSGGDHASAVGEYLSTHPSTEERLRAIGAHPASPPGAD